MLSQGLEHLTWKSLEVEKFVREALNQVSAAHTKLMSLKDNLRAIEAVIASWGKAALIRRKATSTYAPSDFEEGHRQYVALRYAEVADGGKEIHKLLLRSNSELKVSKGAPQWKAYVEFVNDLVIDGLAQLVGASLELLSQQVDKQYISTHELLPMLEVQIELAAPEVVFTPRLHGGTPIATSASTGDGADEPRLPKWILPACIRAFSKGSYTILYCTVL